MTTPIHRVPAVVFVHRGLPWLPHHSLVNVYVAPGGATLMERELLSAAAARKVVDLWPRSWSSKLLGKKTPKPSGMTR